MHASAVIQEQHGTTSGGRLQHAQLQRLASHVAGNAALRLSSGGARSCCAVERHKTVIQAAPILASCKQANNNILGIVRPAAAAAAAASSSLKELH